MPENEQEWRDVARTFETKWNFPNCVGALDGKHVAINKPPDSGSLYYNYKKFFSVVLFAMVDANYRFMYVKTGTNGSASDSTVFESTKLYEKLMTGKLKLPGDSPLPGTGTQAPYVFLGDSAFAINKHFMKPFSLKNITHEKRIFNYRLSRARRVTENAFGILAARFRVLRTPIAVSLDNVDKMILACCALHNYLSTVNPLYLQDDGTLDQEDTVNCTFRPGDWRLNTLAPLCQSNAKQRFEEGSKIRDKFVQYFIHEGSVPFQEDMLTVIPHSIDA